MQLNKMKQTAVDYLVKEFNNSNAKFINWAEEYFEQAKEMENQQQGYSEEEVELIVSKLMDEVHCGDITYGDTIIDFKISPKKWFEQFKKK